MSKSFVTGIDIGHHSIKAVVMKSDGELFELVAYKEVLITNAIFSDNHTLNYQEIVKKLKELKTQLPIMARNAVLSVPDRAVISKLVHIDNELDDSEKEFAIYQSFGQQSPFPVEELSLDYVPVESDVVKPNHTLAYQVYATRKEVIKSRIDTVKKSGFKPIVMDIQAHGLLRVWQLASQIEVEKSNWLLVDIGKTQTSICILPPGRPAYYKDLPFGTQNIKSVAVDSMLNQQLDEQHEFLSELSERLIRQLGMYVSVHQQHKVEGVWLSGGGATLAAMDEMLSDKLNLPVEVLNLQILFKDKVKNKNMIDPCVFGVAAGLAIRGIQWQRRKYVA